MKGPPLGPGGQDITWPDQVVPRSRKASSTSNLKPQTSKLYCKPVNDKGGPCQDHRSGCMLQLK